MKTIEMNKESELVKEEYVKPSVEVYEMEMEGVIMDGASGSDMTDGGGVGRPQSSRSTGLPWDQY